MKRKIYERLLKWKAEEAGRYALMLEGARRVGKSWIVQEFAEREYENHLILDFAKVKKQIKEIFEDKLDDLDDFFLLLEARTGVPLICRGCRSMQAKTWLLPCRSIAVRFRSRLCSNEMRRGRPTGKHGKGTSCQRCTDGRRLTKLNCFIRTRLPLLMRERRFGCLPRVSIACTVF